jgi:hypothetical protein
MKLHAVAPGGPPEGQCEKEQVKWMWGVVFVGA